MLIPPSIFTRVLSALLVLSTALSIDAHAQAPATTNDSEVRPFKIAVAQSDLDELNRRLDATRWPDAETVPDASQGAQLAKVKALVDHWRHSYDWRRVEARINSYPQFVTRIDGVDIHFLHIKSKRKNALPLIMTHGWPGSIVELLDVIGPLTDPTAYGGKADDAFDLVLPSLPGYGFSGKPAEPGWGRARVARAWDTLMKRLGYTRYVAQGGDWGAVVTQEMGHQAPAGLLAIHINMPAVVPRTPPTKFSADEQAAMDSLNAFFGKGAGYAQIQASRPQTIGYALADSPVGQAAWIYEKLAAWSDSNGQPEKVLGYDRMLDDIMMYWLTNTGTSSARFYWENSDLAFFVVGIDIPVGVTVFPKEIYQAPRSWSEQAYPKLMYWNKVARGGHFAAFEQPELFAREVRSAFAGIRKSR